MKKHDGKFAVGSLWVRTISGDLYLLVDRNRKVDSASYIVLWTDSCPWRAVLSDNVLISSERIA